MATSIILIYRALVMCCVENALRFSNKLFRQNLPLILYFLVKSTSFRRQYIVLFFMQCGEFHTNVFDSIHKTSNGETLILLNKSLPFLIQQSHTNIRTNIILHNPFCQQSRNRQILIKTFRAGDYFNLG